MPFHVTIIGAGVAGLTAAHLLQQHNCSITLIEGGNRVGGRTFTRQHERHLEEQGAEFFHPVHHHRLRAALEESGLLAQDLKDLATLWVSAGKGKLGDPVHPEIKALCRHIDTDVALINPHRWITPETAHLDRPFTEYLAKHPASDTVHSEFLAWTGTLTGADPQEFSALGLLRDFKMFGTTEAALTAVEQRIAGGTMQLALSLAKPLMPQIRFETRVVAVHEAVAGFEIITHTDERISADAVIITVPFNTLHQCQFPGLFPALAQASRNRHTNRSRKRWFDPETIFNPRIATDPTSLSYLDVTASAGCIIAADEISGDQAAAHLDLPIAPMASARSHSWQDDPLAAGAWMTIRPGQALVLDDLQRWSIQNPRCQVAGGDVSPIWPGWIEGAIAAGTSAVTRLIQSMTH